MKQSILTKSQTKALTASNIDSKEYGCKVDVVAKVCHDDSCGNGHNSFTITGEVYEAGKRHCERNMIACGCVHEAIEEAFPELRHLIKWHLSSTDEPMHYVANSLHHARGTDYDGLAKGEHSAYVRTLTVQILKDENKRTAVYTSGTLYTNKQNNPHLVESNKKELARVAAFIAETTADVELKVEDVPCAWSISEGKEVDLAAARRSAIWEDAELADFTKEKLEARLPALQAAFQKDVEAFGLVW